MLLSQFKCETAYEQGDTSVRKVAQRFDVSKAFVQKILKQKQTTGHLQPKKPGEAFQVCYTRPQLN
jgi:transposase